MCEHGNTSPVRVVVPADLSSTKKQKWKNAQIDTCIAPIVRALQKGGINMRGSCCGHGKTAGEIILQDGRTIHIAPTSDQDLLHTVPTPGDKTEEIMKRLRKLEQPNILPDAACKITLIG